jgi:hypothetical protein
MAPGSLAPSLTARVVLGLAAGAVIAAVDNLAFAGEVSPIVIVALLLAAAGIAGAFWGRRSWVAALVMAACVPSAHLIKHLLGLPDTLHPNTFASIFKLAGFSLSVAAVGTACGIVLRQLTGSSERNGRA